MSRNPAPTISIAWRTHSGHADGHQHGHRPPAPPGERHRGGEHQHGDHQVGLGDRSASTDSRDEQVGAEGQDGDAAPASSASAARGWARNQSTGRGRLRLVGTASPRRSRARNLSRPRKSSSACRWMCRTLRGVMLCPSCAAPLAPGARFCSSCGHAVAAGQAEERRIVTVLFADVVGLHHAGRAPRPRAGEAAHRRRVRASRRRRHLVRRTGRQVARRRHPRPVRGARGPRGRRRAGGAGRRCACRRRSPATSRRRAPSTRCACASASTPARCWSARSPAPTTRRWATW